VTTKRRLAALFGGRPFAWYSRRARSEFAFVFEILRIADLIGLRLAAWAALVISEQGVSFRLRQS